MSHYHTIDLQEHTFIRHMKEHGKNAYSEDEYEDWLVKMYQQTDNYIGTFLHYLDDGWIIMVTSDHGQVCPEHEPLVGLGDMNGSINVPVLRDYGYTVMVKDENDNDTREVDWSKTRAIMQQGNDIFLNIEDRGNKGRGTLLSILSGFNNYENGSCKFLIRKCNTHL